MATATKSQNGVTRPKSSTKTEDPVMAKPKTSGKAAKRPSAVANQYAATAAALKRGILGHLARPASACDPPVGPCFADGMAEPHTSVQATMYVRLD